jgi:outer membrane murein-binding lipoprotein Lpp
MAITGAQRSRLYLGLEPVVGRENAEVILNSLNFSDVEQVASQADMSAVKTDVATLKTDVGTLKTDVATLKTDVATLKTDVATLKTDVATLKTDVATLKTDVATLKTDMDFRFSLMMETLDKKFLNIKIWFLVTGAGIALAVVNLYKR